MISKQVLINLNYLYKFLEAGEMGYAVAAVNVKNSGLKILFKSYAQQRARFKQELAAEIVRLGGKVNPGNSFRGIIHRGRMNIFAMLIVENDGREKMVLNEILMGEKVVLKTYRDVLKKNLQTKTILLLQRQYKIIRETVEQVNLCLGKDGKRQVVSLYNSERNVEALLFSLMKAGFSTESVEKIALDVNDYYKSKNNIQFDTFISGAAGGALWGSVIGSLAGFGVSQPDAIDPSLMLSPQTIWVIIAILGICGGALVGSILGLFIGLGASEEDTYQYTKSLEHGHVLVKITIDEKRAKEARQILAQGQLEPGY